MSLLYDRGAPMVVDWSQLKTRGRPGAQRFGRSGLFHFQRNRTNELRHPPTAGTLVCVRILGKRLQTAAFTSIELRPSPIHPVQLLE